MKRFAGHLLFMRNKAVAATAFIALTRQKYVIPLVRPPSSKVSTFPSVATSTSPPADVPHTPSNFPC